MHSPSVDASDLTQRALLNLHGPSLPGPSTSLPGRSTTRPRARVSRSAAARADATRGELSRFEVARADTGDSADELACLAQFLYELHARAHGLPHDSFRAWVCTAVARVARASAVWLVMDPGSPGATAQTVKTAETAETAADAPPALMLRAAFERIAPRCDGTAPPQEIALHGAAARACAGQGHAPAALFAFALPAGGGRGDAPWLLVVRDEAPASTAFAQSEQARLLLLREHLGLALTVNRWQQRGQLQHGPGGGAGRVHGVVDGEGNILQSDAGFTALLRRDWPQLLQRLPAALRAHMQSVPTRTLGHALLIECVPVHGGVWLWSLRPRQPVDALSDRQMRVARMFAGGRTYREIAATLELAPATVRRHLQSAYARLGVRSKIALAQRLDAVDAEAAL